MTQAQFITIVDLLNQILENTKPKNNNRFNPPSLEEVEAYCLERNNDVSAQQWLDFYTSKGWTIGKNKMKDWKAAVRTWEQSTKSKRKILSL